MERKVEERRGEGRGGEGKGRVNMKERRGYAPMTEERLTWVSVCVCMYTHEDDRAS